MPLQTCKTLATDYSNENVIKFSNPIKISRLEANLEATQGKRAYLTVLI